MLALPMGLHLGGCVFLWSCILGVSLYPFSSHHPHLGAIHLERSRCLCLRVWPSWDLGEKGVSRHPWELG